MGNYLLKISGAGNRFLLADKAWFEKAPPPDWEAHSYQTNKSFKDFVQLSSMDLAQRKVFMNSFLSEKALHLTDGLVVLKHDSKDNLWLCDFYNKDGSKAEMCGNAAGCIASYMSELGQPLSSFQLGEELVRTVQNSKGEWGISLNSPIHHQGEFPFEFQGKTYSYSLISSGVPHGVIECPLDSDTLDFFKKENPANGKPLFKQSGRGETQALFKQSGRGETQALFKQLAQKLRFKNPSGNQGMNVSFFQVETPGSIKACTYERGVEDFTLACGTGSIAVAFVYLQKYFPDKESQTKIVKVQMPGGTLTVQSGPPPALFSPIKKGF